MAAVALLLRFVIAAGAMHRGDMSPQEMSFLRDGDSYIRVGLSMTGDESTLKPFDRRAFPGYPALIALLATLKVHPSAAALLLNWIGAAAAAVLSALLFGDRRVGWAMAVLTPSYVMYSTLAMSEPTLLVFITAGLLAASGGHALVGGLLVGYAGLIRPVAAFAAVGYITWTLLAGKRKKAIVFGVAALAVVAAGAAILYIWRGDPLEGLKLYATDDRAYGGRPLTWPFASLIMTPLRQKTAPWKVLYIYAHVVVTLAGCALAGAWLRRLFRAGRRGGGEWGGGGREAFVPVMAAVWLWGNTLFCLSVGAHWGFHEFHRFMVPALAPLFFFLRGWIPDRWFFWLGAAAVSAVLGVWGIQH